MAKFKAWSFSLLDAFELCPRKLKAERIDKSVKETENPMQDYGKDAHKAFENRLLKGKELPLDLRHHESILARIASAPGKGYPEQKLAINAAFEPTGFFDDDVWCRSIVDYLKVQDDHGVLIDHKFGKQKEGYDQLRLCSVMVMATIPELKTISAAYYWAKAKKFTRIIVTRFDIPTIWADFLPRVKKMEAAYERDEFPERPNFLCARHCQVTGCPNFGKRSPD